MSDILRVYWRTDNPMGFRIASGTKHLNSVTLLLEDYDANNYAKYVVSAAQVADTGEWTAQFPSGAPVGPYDILPVEATNGTSFAPDTDLAAGGYLTFTYNGTNLLTDPGTGIDTTVALITLAEAKQYLGESGTESDAQLAALINEVSSWIAPGYLGRELVSKQRTEYYHGDGSGTLLLRNVPIISIASVYLDANRAWTSDTQVDLAADAVIDKGAGLIRLWNTRASWYWGFQNVKVTYTAGYTVGPGGTLPPAIKLAVKRTVKRQWTQGMTGNLLDLSAQNIGDKSNSFRDADLSSDVKSMLDPFRDTGTCVGFAYAD